MELASLNFIFPCAVWLWNSRLDLAVSFVGCAEIRLAPSATAMLHAGVLKKFGLYGLIRVALRSCRSRAKLDANPRVACSATILTSAGWRCGSRDMNLLFGNSAWRIWHHLLGHRDLEPHRRDGRGGHHGRARFLRH